MGGIQFDLLPGPLAEVATQAPELRLGGTRPLVGFCRNSGLNVESKPKSCIFGDCEDPPASVVPVSSYGLQSVHTRFVGSVTPASHPKSTRPWQL